MSVEKPPMFEETLQLNDLSFKGTTRQSLLLNTNSVDEEGPPAKDGTPVSPSAERSPFNMPPKLDSRRGSGPFVSNFVRKFGPTNLTIVPAKVEEKTEVKQEKPYTNMIPPTVIPNEHTNAYKAAFQQQMAKYNTLTKLHEEISRKRNQLLIDELKQDLFKENVDIFQMCSIKATFKYDQQYLNKAILSLASQPARSFTTLKSRVKPSQAMGSRPKTAMSIPIRSDKFAPPQPSIATQHPTQTDVRSNKLAEDVHLHSNSFFQAQRKRSEQQMPLNHDIVNSGEGLGRKRSSHASSLDQRNSFSMKSNPDLDSKSLAQNKSLNKHILGSTNMISLHVAENSKVVQHKNKVHQKSGSTYAPKNYFYQKQGIPTSHSLTPQLSVTKLEQLTSKSGPGKVGEDRNEMVLVENSHILIPLTPNELKEIVLRNRPNSSLSSKITPEAEVARQRLSIQYQVTVDNTKQGIWGLKSMSDFDSQQSAISKNISTGDNKNRKVVKL